MFTIIKSPRKNVKDLGDEHGLLAYQRHFQQSHHTLPSYDDKKVNTLLGLNKDYRWFW